MTAFARHEISGPWGIARWEVRAVNHRYLDIQLNLPDILGDLEPIVRETIRKYIQRGKLDCTLQYRCSSTQQGTLQINKQLVEQLVNAGREVGQQLVDILAWPGVIQRAEKTIMREPIIVLFEKTLQDLVSMRAREGAGLTKMMEERLAKICGIVQNLRIFLPGVAELQRKKIIARFYELEIALDPLRLEQEMILFLQRADVTEELDRLEIHIKAIRWALNQPGAQGRRLDFLMQELHREANTLGAKSVDSVEIKVLIEQMREQVQNVE
ncbi:MAG: YicC/YloC family endoribonuclease [Gammaproteobacteria bacterium]